MGLGGPWVSSLSHSQSQVASGPLAFIFFECTLSQQTESLLEVPEITAEVSRDTALPILAGPHVLVSISGSLKELTTLLFK